MVPPRSDVSNSCPAVASAMQVMIAWETATTLSSINVSIISCNHAVDLSQVDDHDER